MAIDIIKSYLVSIGFNVDESSLNSAKSSMNQAQDNVKKFNDENKKGFSESGDSLKDLFNLFKLSSTSIGKVFPELQKPFNGLVKDINNIKKLYNDSIKQVEKQPEKVTGKKTSKQNTSDNKSNLPSVNLNNNKLVESSKNLSNQILNVKNAAKGLAEEGGSALEGFGAEAVGSLGAVTAGATALVAALVIGTVELAKFLNSLAQQDIGYEKLSRQLWTTKENAKEVDMALKTMGVSMQDLWLSPTLLKQFNELRKDSAALKLPKEYTDNLKTVQSIGLEFSRLKQLGSLAFQWIGNYILKYAAGPLKEIKQALNGFNNWIVKNMPEIAKSIGVPIGILARGIYDIIQLFALIIEKSPFGQLIKWIQSLPEPVKNTIKKISILVQPLLFILALLDDVMTYFKGGKSVIGGFFDKIKEGMNGIKDGWNYYYNKAVEVFEKIRKKAKEVWDAIKNFFPDLWDKAKGLAVEAGQKVQEFAGSVNLTATPAYAMPGISNTSSQATTNSNNKINNTNTNTFNVYSNNPNATANAVASKVSGLNTRNMQGVF